MEVDDQFLDLDVMLPGTNSMEDENEWNEVVDVNMHLEGGEEHVLVHQDVQVSTQEDLYETMEDVAP